MSDPYQTVSELIERGNRLAEAGNLADAKTVFEQACRQDKKSGLAHFGLGTIYYRLNDDKKAERYLSAAARLSPNIPEIWNNLGACYGRTGKVSMAIWAFQTVCKLQPDHAPAAMNLGRLLVNDDQAEEGERWLSLANQIRPHHSETLRLLAEARVAMGQPSMAVTAAQKAITSNPKNWAAHLVLGHAYLSIRKLELARQELELVLEHQPNHSEATYYLAETEEKSGRIEHARELFDRVMALDLDPSFLALLQLKRVLALPVIAESIETIIADRTRIEQALTELTRPPIADPYGSGGFTNFYLAYQGQNDRDLQQKIANYYLDVCPDLATSAPHVAEPQKRERFKVAFLTSFLRNHTVGYLCRGLVEHLDRKRFSVTVLRSPIIPVDDPIAREIALQADEVIDLPDNLPAARERVAKAKADLIYFPEIGMEDLVYFLAFARSAPVQVVGWGHPVTTGIPNVDVFLSVADMEPEDSSPHYSERLITLASLSLCVSRPRLDETNPDRSNLGLEPGLPAYLCAQSLYKIHPEFDPIVAAILEKDRDAHVYFISLGNQSDDIFLSRLERTVGQDMDRVHLIPRVPSKEFLLLLKSADVLLDVPHWSGGKTSLESLAAGTPIVHWPGPYMRGRHTLAFYKRMGVMDCIVDSAEDYVTMAIRLVNDESFRTSVRTKIANTAGALFDDTSAIDEISDVFETLIRDAR